MKSRFLLAMALPMAFAACTNDDLDSAFNASQDAVGADLVGSNISINVTRGNDEATSRLSSTGWADGDKVGLGWFNLSNTGISAEQFTKHGDVIDWPTDGAAITGTYANATDVLYANHLFKYTDGVFTNEGDVYAGAYFAYYPWQRQKSAARTALAIDLNTTQTTADSKDAYYQNVFSISPVDKITDDDVTNVGTVTKSFATQSLSNALVLNTTLVDDDDYTAEQIAAMKISSITISTNALAFYTHAKVCPSKLPTAIYTNKVLDTTKSLKKIVDKTNATDKTFAIQSGIIGTAVSNAIQLLSVPTGASANADAPRSVTLAVKDTDASLATENKGFVFSLFPDASFTPVSGSLFAAANVTITIKAGAGKLTITHTGKSEVPGSAKAINNAAIEKLVALYSKDGYKETSTSEGLKMSKIIPGRVVLDLAISMDNYDVAYNDISNADEWNQAVQFADLFNVAKPEFNITGNVEFTSENPMTLPKNGLVNVTATRDNKIVIASGTQTIAKAIKVTAPIEIKEKATLVVAEGTQKVPTYLTLNGGTFTNDGTLKIEGRIAGKGVDPDAEGKGLVAYDVITNNATVNVGVNGQVCTGVQVENRAGTSTLAAGVITCGMNSYVRHNANGVIKGILDGSDATTATYYAYLINRMVDGQTGSTTTTDFDKDDAPVAVNTLEFVNMGTVATGDKANINNTSLPWGDAGTHEITATLLQNIDVILNGTTLSNAKSATTVMTVKSLSSKGTSGLKGLVAVTGDINVTAGSLAVDQLKIGTAKTLARKITATNVNVSKGATLNVTKAVVVASANLTNAGNVTVAGTDEEDNLGRVAVTKINNTGVITVTGNNGKTGVDYVPFGWMTYVTANNTTGATETGSGKVEQHAAPQSSDYIAQ